MLFRSGKATVEITNDDTEGIFTTPSSIEFADGETIAAINVAFDRSVMQASTVYSVKISLPEHPISGKATNYTLSVRRD